MGIWIYIAQEASDPYGPACALFQDSVTGVFFGTAFADEEDADAFLRWSLDQGMDPRLLVHTWTEALNAWRTDERLGMRDPTRCRELYCFAKEPKDCGWGLCIDHAAASDDEEDHRNCPGCDDCEPWRLGEDP